MVIQRKWSSHQGFRAPLQENPLMDISKYKGLKHQITGRWQKFVDFHCGVQLHYEKRLLASFPRRYALYLHLQSFGTSGTFDHKELTISFLNAIGNLHTFWHVLFARCSQAFSMLLSDEKLSREFLDFYICTKIFHINECCIEKDKFCNFQPRQFQLQAGF